MNARPLGLALGMMMLLSAGCRERQQAVAAEPPSLEIKAAVAQPRTVTVAAGLDGRVQTIHAREGARVNANDPLVALTNPTVDRDLAYSRAQLAHAEHRLRVASAPARRSAPRIDDAERLQAMEELVRNRKARLDRYQNLYNTKDISVDELELAQAEYSAAVRDLAAERRNAQNEAIVQPSDPRLLQLDLDKARAEAAVIEERRRQLAVAAPMNGVVTRVLVSEGDTVYPRDPLVEITDASVVDVRGAVAPELLRYLKPGARVDVKVFTVPPRRFSTFIKQVVPATDSAGASVVVSVPNPDGVLAAGTAATITVR